MKSCSSDLLTQHPTLGISTVAGIELNVGTINGGTVLQIIRLGPFQSCLQISLNHHQHLIYIVGHMSDASDASDAVSTPSTVFSRVAASAAWKRLNRLMPALAAAVILLMGFMLIAVTPAGHIPDVWAHTYRIDGIVNGDVLARPVDSTSILHSGSGNVGGCVSRDWIQFSISADSMAQALCLLFACLLFSCMADPRAGNGRLAALMTVGVLIGMSKFTFTPLLLLGFLALIPWHSAVSESTAVPSAADAARA